MIAARLSGRSVELVRGCLRCSGLPAYLSSVSRCSPRASLALGVAKPAAAELVDHSHQHVVATFDEVICRIPVTTTLDHVLNSKERLSSTGFPLLKSTGSGTYTSTNPANGKSVLLGFAGSSSDL